MKEKNVLFGTATIVNAILLFSLFWINDFRGELESDFVLFGLMFAHIILAAWLFKRSGYSVRSTAKVINFQTQKHSKTGEGYDRAIVTLEYQVNGTPIRNTVTGIYEDLRRYHKGNVCCIGYKKGNPYRIILIHGRGYQNACLLIVIELIILVIVHILKGVNNCY